MFKPWQRLARRLAVMWLFFGLCLVSANWAMGQLGEDPLGLDFSQANSAAADDQAVVELSAYVTPARAGLPPRLYLTAEVQPGWHIYSITQAKGGPLPTKIRLAESKQVHLAGEFTAQPKPKVSLEADVWPDLPIETHEGRVTWSAPLEIAADTPLEALRIDGTLEAQACNATGCLPPKEYSFTAKVKALAGAVGQYHADNTHATIRGQIAPRTIAPGEPLRLTLSVEPTAGYHVYAYADHDPKGISKPTLIVVNAPSSWETLAPTADRAPHEEPSDIEPQGVVRFYEKPVTWTVEVRVPDDVKAGDYRLSGIIGYQTCYDGGCDRMTAANFEALVTVGGQDNPRPTPLVFSGADYSAAARLAADHPPAKSKIASRASSGSVLLVLAAALLGGFILNFMPCVLPVIGLKILSFVEQSHDDRKRVLTLNLWYTFGLISVFMVLATLASFLSMGWGQQFTSQAFNLVLICLVFAMALSFLGVWEIPIPGFVGTGKAGEMATKEGASGAFAKGIFTTVLATPCSGPFLGPVFGYTLTQPPWLVYAIFGCVGLGMASPYLLIGAFPSLIRFLPKPGAWMDTFKQVMGFVLLGTVVFLFTFIQAESFVRTFAVLVAIWAGCWWIGRQPITVNSRRRMLAWTEALAVPALVALVAFGHIMPNHELPWKPYSPTQLERLTSTGHTVMVDFTANWCLTCQTNGRIALNTREVKKLVEQNAVVPLLADWTDGSPEIKQKLNELGSNSIPLCVIYPADRPSEPIVLRDLISKQQVLDALEKAGPSRSRAGAERTAMR